MITYCPTCANMLLGEARCRSCGGGGLAAWAGRCVGGERPRRRLNCVVGATARGLLPPAPCLCAAAPLAVELTDYSKELRYFCQSCPYVYCIDKKVNRAAGVLAGLCHRHHAERPRPWLQFQYTSVSCALRAQITRKAPIARKDVDDVLGGEDAWKNVAKTDGEPAAARGAWRRMVQAGHTVCTPWNSLSHAMGPNCHCKHTSAPPPSTPGLSPPTHPPPPSPVPPDPRNPPSSAAVPSPPPSTPPHPPPPHASPPAATCGKCSYHQAYFMEVQTRSADEPATLFFKCVQCGQRWKEG